ncbi:MAG: 4-phosphopantetheinyl transferase [Thermoleophilaceae bacterium]|nr:4-phosphopantetheinyl transferase [Thermoleophilaceae bacterium]
MITPSRWPGTVSELVPGAVQVWSTQPGSVEQVLAAYESRRGVRSNVSRSGELALVAVASERIVGVDVEAMRPGRRLQAIADSRFTPGEAAALRALDETEQDMAFYRLWVRKEAYLKAAGEGIAGGLDSFDALTGKLPAGWELIDLDVGEGYAGAVVTGPAGAARRSR